MPYAVTHILIPILLVAIFRDFYLKERDKKSFPLHYVLIAGLGGVLPDIDIAVFWLIQHTGIAVSEVHRVFTHLLIVPLSFLVLSILFFAFEEKIKVCKIREHKLRLSIIALMLFIGSLSHILLDAFVSGPISPFVPFSNLSIGFSLASIFSESARGVFSATLDGVLLIIWIVYLELKHKISDFI